MDSPYVASFVEGLRKVRGQGKDWRDQRIGMARAIDLASLPREERERAVRVLSKLTEADVSYRMVFGQNVLLGLLPLLLAVAVPTLMGLWVLNRYLFLSLGIGLGVVLGSCALVNRACRLRLRSWFRNDAAHCAQDIAALFSSVPQFAATQDMLEALGATEDPAPWILTRTQSIVLTSASSPGSPN